MKPRRARSIPLPGGARTFHRLYTRLGCKGRPPHFQVEFYPYANLTHTIRLREDTADVRLSDLLRDAPPAVIEAAAALLLARLYRRPVPRELVAAYRDFSLARRTRRRLKRMRRVRARPLTSGPRGRFHDLARLFAQLNQRYFSGRLHQPRLGWSLRGWRAQLGCFDPGLDQIAVNSRLDRSSVPSFVVEYVLYHEMLHLKHPLRAARCGLEAHSLAFRREEKRFTWYDRARRFLNHL